tara:strand:- start:2114 stop:2326 length:213 start_codon:yes stop_codon:yes gene_type:complete
VTSRKRKLTDLGKNDETAIALEVHEEICALRYENIDKRLESGSKRFARVEGMIIGIYVLIIGTQVISQVM